MSYSNSCDCKDKNGRSYKFISHEVQFPPTKIAQVDDVGSLESISRGLYERTFVMYESTHPGHRIGRMEYMNFK